MSTQPRALDLFCGAGGATRGLQQAGFHVTGVDINPQPRYVGDAFHQADAMTFPLEGFDFIWASPPCQVHSDLSVRLPEGHSHIDLIEKTRARLRAAGVPFAIENVSGAPLIRPLTLCGTMFGLTVDVFGTTYELQRHRLIETGHFIWNPPECQHKHHVLGVYGDLADKMRCNNPNRPGHGWKAGRGDAAALMQIDWMNPKEISQAIPPAYSRYIGEQMMPHVLRAMGTRGAA